MKFISNDINKKYISKKFSFLIRMITNKLFNENIRSITSINHFIEQNFVHAHHLFDDNIQKICNSMQTKIIVSSIINALIFFVISLYFFYESKNCKLMNEYVSFFFTKIISFFSDKFTIVFRNIFSKNFRLQRLFFCTRS